MDEVVSVEWLESIGFKWRNLGPFERLCKPLGRMASSLTPYLCVSAPGMKYRFCPHLLHKNGSNFTYCFPRMKITKGEVLRFIDLFSGREHNG